MKPHFPSSSDLTSDNAAMGCLSGVLRRLLCGNLRHRASQQLEEDEPNSKPELRKPTPAPGLVARLMGLDSMPVHPYTPPPASMGKSRSTSSLDSWPVFLSGERSHGSPQIRTSSSFREAPTFLTKENEDFLLLSFAPDDKGGIFDPVGVKPKMGTKEFQQWQREITASMTTERKIEERRVCKRSECSEKIRSRSKLDDAAAGGKPVKQRERSERSKVAKRRSVHAQSRIELECSSDNSSPNSVLDNPFDVDRQNTSMSTNSPISDDKKRNQRNSRRKLSSELDKQKTSSSRTQSIPVAEEAVPKAPTIESNLECLDFWRHICRLTEEDVKNSNWDTRELRKIEEAGEITAVVGMEVLDFLLHEAVAELSNTMKLSICT